MQEVLLKIIDCLLKQSSTDIDLVYLGEIYQNGLEIGKIFIEDGADSL
jgi:hypothetical protein